MGNNDNTPKDDGSSTLTERQLRSLLKKPVRTCQTMHECCVCLSTIRYSWKYYDGGFNRRAHVGCVEAALSVEDKGVR